MGVPFPFFFYHRRIGAFPVVTTEPLFSPELFSPVVFSFSNAVCVVHGLSPTAIRRPLQMMCPFKTLSLRDLSLLFHAPSPNYSCFLSSFFMSERS